MIGTHADIYALLICVKSPRDLISSLCVLERFPDKHYETLECMRVPPFSLLCVCGCHQEG